MRRLNVIGPAVRRLRVGRGLTQEALTARCQLAGWNLSRPTVGKIEAGLRQVTDAELWMLARVLDCAVADLLPRNARAVTPVLRQGED